LAGREIVYTGEDKGTEAFMTHDTKQEQVAIFRYGLIAPALHMSQPDRSRYFKELAGRELDVPHYGIKVFKRGTFQKWLWDYRRGGLEKLKPLLRSDRGVCKKITDPVAAAIREAIGTFPYLSCSGIHRLLAKEGYMKSGAFCENTLRRYIQKHDLRLGDREVIGRKKYEKENINELWISDFMYGPHLLCGRKRRRTYLCAIIDDHSRMIVGWSWAFSENVTVLAATFKKAIGVHGLPQVFYCDNGSVFVSHYLHLVCANMGVALVHSKPYDSPSRGKVERFFRTVRDKFLAGLEATGLTLDTLQGRFLDWLDTDYHKTIHAGIQECPLDRYLRGAARIAVKTLPAHELDQTFLNTLQRRVKNDATVSVDKKLYEVPPAYIGKTVALSFPIDAPERITLVEAGKPMALLKLVNPNENANKPHTAIHFKDIPGGAAS
jgi:putative transposase